MRLTSLALCTLICFALGGAAVAQVTYTAGQGVPGQPEACYMPTAAYPNGQAAPFVTPFLPNAAALPPVPVSLQGGMASLDRRGIFYTTNGTEMAMDANPLYAAFGPLPAVPGGPIPIAIPFGAGPVTGLGYDDAAGVLWACDTMRFWQMSPLPPFNALSIPQPIPGLLGPATGLAHEASTNTLWACDPMGCVYHFTPGGAPIGAQPVSTVPVVGSAQGVAVDTSNGPGAFATPACSTEIAGYHVTISDGFNVYDAQLPNPPIPLAPLVAANTIYGHCCSADFQIKRCPSTVTPFSTPFAGTQRVNWVGPGAPGQSLRCVGALPSTPALLIFDGCPQPTCWLGLWLSPFTWGTAGTATDAAGEITFPVPFGAAPPGVQISFQFAILNPPAPLGYDLSTLATFTTALP